MRILLVIVLGLIVFSSCKAKPALEVKYIGEVHSRKSYASIQFMEEETEIDAYLERERKAEPMLLSNRDTNTVTLFKKAGFIDNDRFLLSKLQKDSAASTFFSAASDIKYPLTFYVDTVGTETIHFRISNGKTTITVNTGARSPQNLDYAFVDIIPGGNKELVFIDDYYIMNGDNYNFCLYEIITP